MTKDDLNILVWPALYQAMYWAELSKNKTLTMELVSKVIKQNAKNIRKDIRQFIINELISFATDITKVPEHDIWFYAELISCLYDADQIGIIND